MASHVPAKNFIIMEEQVSGATCSFCYIFFPFCLNLSCLPIFICSFLSFIPSSNIIQCLVYTRGCIECFIASIFYFALPSLVWRTKIPCYIMRKSQTEKVQVGCRSSFSCMKTICYFTGKETDPRQLCQRFRLNFTSATLSCYRHSTFIHSPSM